MTEYESKSILIGWLGAITTFLAVVVALFIALFGDSIKDWFTRPIIKVEYDQRSDRCFRSLVPIGDRVQEFPQFIPQERQCFRLRVSNDGKRTARRVKVVIDLYYENKEEAERFEPNALKWVGSNQETIDIANKEVAYINLLSQITKVNEAVDKIPHNFFVIRWEIFNFTPRAIAWDRESRKYLIKVIVHGDNFESKEYWLQFTPNSNKDIFTIGDLRFRNALATY